MSDIPDNVPRNSAGYPSVGHLRPRARPSDVDDMFGIDESDSDSDAYEEIDYPDEPAEGDADYVTDDDAVMPEDQLDVNNLEPPPHIGRIPFPENGYPSHMVIQNPHAYNPHALHVYRRIIPCPESVPAVEATPVLAVCQICMTNQINTVLDPCCHASMCTTCAEELVRRQDKCPTCRRAIRQVYRLFLSTQVHACPVEASLASSSSSSSSSEPPKKKRKKT